MQHAERLYLQLPPPFKTQSQPPFYTQPVPPAHHAERGTKNHPKPANRAKTPLLPRPTPLNGNPPVTERNEHRKHCPIFRAFFPCQHPDLHPHR